MMLPYSTALSFWIRAIPQFEWQSDQRDLPSSMPETSCGEYASPLVAGDTREGLDSQDKMSHEAPPPHLHLVMSGVRWIAVPYWTPRENPCWETMAQDARDEDKRRTEATTLQAKRGQDLVAAPVPSRLARA